MRKSEVLNLHVSQDWNTWEAVEVNLELISDDPYLGQRFAVKREGADIGVLERDSITQSTTVRRIRYDNKPKTMWRAKAGWGERFNLWRDTRTDALAQIMKIEPANVHNAGRPGWRTCGICGGA